MSRYRLHAVTFAAALLGMLCACGAGGPPLPAFGAGGASAEADYAQGRPDLSGHWTLDAAESDDLDALLDGLEDEMNAARRGGVVATPDPAHGGVPVATALAHPGYPFNDMHGFLDDSASLRIQHEDPVLRITTDTGRVQELYTDLRGSSVSAAGSARQQVTVAGWEQGAVVVETPGGNGVGLLKRYRLDTGGTRLYVEYELTLERVEESITVVRVYDRAGP